jgi:integrase
MHTSLAVAAKIAKANRRYEAGLMLIVCGLAGLRLSEVARLQPEDLQGDLLTVGARVAKTENSRRVIPVCSVVARKLASYFDMAPPLSENKDTISKQMRTLLRAAHGETNDPAFKMVDARDLRKTLGNVLADELNLPFIRSYYGHSSTGVTLKHYVALIPKPDGQTDEVRSHAIQRMREMIVQPLEEKLIGLAF